MYKSRFQKLKPVFLPKFSNTRVLMLPILLEDIESLPNDLVHYKQTVQGLIEISPVKEGVAYLTIDEKFVKQGDTLRLKGLHVDGIGADNRPQLSIWATHGIRNYVASLWDEGYKKWYHGAAGIGGFITVSSPAGCRAWDKDFTGRIYENGDCEGLRSKFPDSEGIIFESGVAYWCGATCVHESLPMGKDTERTFVRLSMPSEAPWYYGYTKNPKGILAKGVTIGGPQSGFYRPGEPEVILNG